jgi:riboflavin biosynthesis pyrimidine reductase
VDQLLKALADRGTKSVYVDGGQVIREFLQAGLIDDITITTVPVLIGSGIPFPGELDADIALIHQSTKVLAAGLVQSAYAIDRCRPRPQMLSRQCL